MKNVSILFFAALVLTGCNTTNSGSAPSPAVSIDPAKEAKILDEAAVEIEASHVTHSLTAMRISSATISGPSPGRQFLSDTNFAVYCVDMTIETLLIATQASAVISVPVGPDGGGRAQIGIKRDAVSGCAKQDARPFTKLIQLRDERRKRFDAEALERQRTHGGSPAVIR